MKAFRIPHATMEEALNQFHQLLRGRQLEQMVKITCEGSELTLTFSKLGTSTVTYKFTASPEGGFLAKFDREKIAFAHKPFRSEIEGKVFQVFEQIGIKVV